MKRSRDSIGRRSRMHASSTGKRIRLTERDLAWLQAIHRHGPLASSYLLKFGKPFGQSQKRAQERLGDLFHEDNTEHGGAYLIRPAQQFQTIDSRYNQLVYNLAPAAEKALKQERLWSDRSVPNGGPWWHTFMVSSITSSIEIGCVARGDLQYIPQSQILNRADSPLSCSVSYRDPILNKQVKQVLKPDAIFGIEYATPSGQKFRFFAVEADRSTEPRRSKSSSRKTLQKSLLQYEQLIAGQAYRQQFSLTAPLLLLMVTTSPARSVAITKMIDEQELRSRSAMLVCDWSCFGDQRAIPGIKDALLDQPWTRSNLPPISIA